MAEIVKVNVKINAEEAIKDPLFWLGMIVSRVSFGRLDIGRWRKYVVVEEVES